MTVLATKLPPGGWRLLNCIYGTVTGTQHTVSAATLINRCGVNVPDLVEMSSFGAGLVYAVNRRGDHMTMAPDAAMADDLKRLYLHLTPRGVDWVTGTPENRVLFALDRLGIAPVKKVMAESGVDDVAVYFALEDAGLLSITFGPPGEAADRGPVRRTAALISTISRGDLVHARLTRKGIDLVFG